MEGSIASAGNPAIKAAGQPVSDSETTDRTDSDGSDWFYKMAQPLLGKDGGLALSVLTGFEERSCYRYVTADKDKRRPPPGYLLRTLIRSELGEPWLRALMDGCDAKWWLAMQRECRVGRSALREAGS